MLLLILLLHFNDNKAQKQLPCCNSFRAKYAHGLAVPLRIFSYLNDNSKNCAHATRYMREYHQHEFERILMNINGDDSNQKKLNDFTDIKVSVRDFRIDFSHIKTVSFLYEMCLHADCIHADVIDVFYGFFHQLEAMLLYKNDPDFIPSSWDRKTTLFIEDIPLTTYATDLKLYAKAVRNIMVVDMEHELRQLGLCSECNVSIISGFL